MSENLDNMNAGEAKRPTFLTVLCILTFIGSGLGVLGGILGLLGSSVLASFAPAGGTVLVSALSLLASILCLFGAIQMWGLKKMGFMLYLGGSVLSLIVGIMNAMSVGAAMDEISDMSADMGAEMSQVNDAMSNVASTAAWTGFAMGLVITLVFVLMYNANRKHLVK
ncbi:MAG: hypothetical protein NWQ47_03460 [Crocinitomicaceae bacterium]|nr:hypothetical protein [Crocinitomicaceae bacterium]